MKYFDKNAKKCGMNGWWKNNPKKWDKKLVVSIALMHRMVVYALFVLFI